MSFVYSGPRLLLLRHGETQWNRQGRLQGRKNSPLTDLGRAQARQQGHILKQIKGVESFDAVCSPLGRAQETALIALGAVGKLPRFDPLVAEINAGDWEGKTYGEIVDTGELVKDCNMMRLFLTAPGGEGFDNLRARCVAFLSGLERPTILVSHSVTLCMIRGLIRDLPRKDIEALDRPQGAVYDVAAGQETLFTLH
ncbi:histidine phosphatase family protein [Shimia sagamensis]|uniref:Probable phosphoglycerate mutase n=1 Tax=Shimia sagamensis TaxID=1566352 RepID=A0ABY1PKL5_9RHOB|nr:histidine phosphatase family protein [Shimia sagamensis]SMP35720.1 probable phosphoglycerate mutase [Shimia sagamensis]